MIRDRMAQMGFRNLSAYVRKMGIDGYYIHVDFKELLEIIRLMRIDSNNINQILRNTEMIMTQDLLFRTGCETEIQLSF